MKKKNLTLAIIAFLMFAGVSKAQDSTSNNKMSFGKWLTKTPWQVSFGGNIIDDGNKSETFKALDDYAFYPAQFTAEKNLKKGWNAQFAFSSTSINPHNFLAVDLNAKYDFNNLIGDTKWFDPFGVLGLGYTYRDRTLLASGGGLNVINFNAGLGANFWLFPNMGITAQGLAKFAKDNYLQASLGLVFKIGNCEAPKCEATPKTQEAQDALQHLRGIINK
jgi:hypothetical protein